MIITAGKYKGRKILTPDEKITRPTLSKVRMGVFNTLYSIIGDFEGLSFLDVFGGSGIMGLEALSRGFSTVSVYEKNLQLRESGRKMGRNDQQYKKQAEALLYGELSIALQIPLEDVEDYICRKLDAMLP